MAIFRILNIPVGPLQSIKGAHDLITKSIGWNWTPWHGANTVRPRCTERVYVWTSVWVRFVIDLHASRSSMMKQGFASRALSYQVR